jgi:Protein of unknown function (DUF3180)
VRPTRPSALAAIAAICGVAAWLAVRATFASLPTLPWTAVPALLLLAIGETGIGRNLRARIRGRGSGKPVAPIAVARVVALAKASSAAAAALGGLAAGFLIYVVGSLDKAVPRGDAIAAGLTLASAAVLVAAALYLENCCRAPRPPEAHDDPPGHNRQDAGGLP